MPPAHYDTHEDFWVLQEKETQVFMYIRAKPSLLRWNQLPIVLSEGSTAVVVLARVKGTNKCLLFLGLKPFTNFNAV